MTPGMDSLMNAKQVAEMLGVSVRWVLQHASGANQAKSPQIPCVRVGRCVRFKRESLDEWLKQLENAA